MLETYMTHMLSIWPSKTLVDKLFLKGSIRFFTKVIVFTTTSPFNTISHIKRYFLSMFLSFWWFLGSLNYVTISLLSQNKTNGDITKGTIPIPIKNIQSQTVSFIVSKVTNILCFHSGVSNTRLFHIFPTNTPTT